MLQKIIQSNRNSIIILLLLTAVCFSPIVKNEFVTFDDGLLIRYSYYVTNNDVPFTWIFNYNFTNPHYKPLVYMGWRIEYSLFGDNPLPFHMNNLLLHFLNTILVFFLALKILPLLKIQEKHQRFFAFVLALLFALHPLHVESVAWASERKDVQYSLFFLLSWLAYIRHLENRKPLYMVLAILGYVATLLSKSMGITLVAVLALTEWFYFRKIDKKMVLRLVPFVLVFLGGMYMYGMFTNFEEHAAGITSKTILSQTEDRDFFADYPVLLKRILMISMRLVLWIVHIIIPLIVSVMYPREQIIEFFGKSILLFPLILAAILWLTWKWRNKKLLFAFGIAFFIITISPAIAISEKGSGVFLPDRYTYIPALGIYLAALALIMKIKVKKSVANLLILSYFLFIGVKSHAQVKVWRNSETLWNNTLKHFPGFPRALNSRGAYFKGIGEREKALKDFTEAIKNDPNYMGAYSNRCDLLFSMGRYEEALADINVLLKSDAGEKDYYTTAAGILFKLNRIEDAEKFALHSIEIDADNLEPQKNLAIIYLKQKKYNLSVEHWQKCIELEPRNPLNYADMGYALLMAGRNEEALEAYNQAIKMRPELASAWYNRSYTHMRLGNKQKALEDALQAKKLGANVTDSYLNRLR